MEIVLISDGPLPLDSPVRKLPFFFPARLVDMADVSSRTVGQARVAVIELLDASEAGLTALKKAWSSIAQIPVLCLISTKDRREVMQAAALGKPEVVQRDTPLSVLVRKVRGKLGDDLADKMPDSVPAEMAEAYRKGSAFLEGLALSATDGSKIQINLLNESANEILTTLSRYGMAPWMDAIHSHHSPTYRHSLMVAGVAGLFARFQGADEAGCREMVAGGLIHDIGKMRIPLTILDKPGRLTDEEREIVDRHVEFGREILKPRLELPFDIKKMAIQHHECLDGSGYPDGLKGDKISPKVRQMTICDIFCALTEARIYKDSLPTRVAIDMMRKMDGKLDQDMLHRFSEMVLDRSFGDVSRVKASEDA
ncbi:MAG: HD domain-containing protein [Roseibium sp.]